MTAWWEGLSGVLQVLYCIAIPATLLLIVQTILTVIGFGDGGGGMNPSDTSGLDMGGDISPDAAGADFSMDADMTADAAGDVSADSDSGSGADTDYGTLRLFTFQGIVAFLATFSWVAIWLVKGGMQLAPSLLLGGICGAIMMYVVAKLLQVSARLAENGTFNIKSTIGENAQVYVTIPPHGESGGKVTLTLERGFVELDAITEEDEQIVAGAAVRIVDVRGDTVVVEVL